MHCTSQLKALNNTKQCNELTIRFRFNQNNDNLHVSTTLVGMSPYLTVNGSPSWADELSNKTICRLLRSTTKM